MPFRVKIIPPIRVTEPDLQRRQRRYQERAAPDTQIAVCELPDGPPMLYTPDDLEHSDDAVLRRGFVVVKVPYNLRLTEEVKIYKLATG